MKKVLIAFLAVFMLVLFVSCDQKALEEAEKREQATVDFFETFANVFFKYSFLADSDDAGEYDLAKYNSEESADTDAKTAANKMIQKLLWANKIDYSSTDFKVTSAKGTIKIVATTDNTEISWTAKDVEVSYKYKDEDEDVTGNISLGGEVRMKQSKDTETELITIEMVVKSFMVNGKTHRPIELIMRETVDGFEIDKSICDGIELNKKMVKAAIGMIFGII